MNRYSLDTRFSTTRLLLREKPADLRELPLNSLGRREGGLRTKGHYKWSYRKKPLISIIQPVFNAAHCLERSIQSVLRQSYDNVEYLVVDGDSGDGTVEMIRRWEDYIDYWVSERDLGIYDAMNKGVAVARGDWLYFLGADDILINNLHRIVPHLKRRNRIYYGDTYWPKENRVYDGKFTWHKLIGENICHQAIFYPRGVFQFYKYNLNYCHLADYDLNIRLWTDHRFKFKYLPILVSVFENGGKSSQGDLKFEKDMPELIRIAFSRRIQARQIYLAARALGVGTLEKLGLKKPLLRLLRGG